MNAVVAISLLFLCSLSTVLTSEYQREADRKDISGQNEKVDSEKSNSGTLINKVRQLLDSDADELLIWKVENSEPVVTDTTNYEKFESDKAYLVIEMRKNGHESMEESQIPDIYYWIGKYYTNVIFDRVESFSINFPHGNADYVSLSSALNSAVNLHKEIEGEETLAFKATLEYGERVLPETYFYKKRMFLIKDGPSGTHFVAVHPSLKYVQDNQSCIILNVKVVYEYCGSSVSEMQKINTEQIAKMYLQMKSPDAKKVTIYRDGTSLMDLPLDKQLQMLQFFLEFENIPKQTMRRGTSSLHNEITNRLRLQAAFSSAKEKQKKVEEHQGSSSFGGHFFKKFLSRKKSKVEPSENFINKTRRMILIIGGSRDLKIREEKISLEHFRGNNNCIVLGMKAVYVYCGYAASEEQEYVATDMAKPLLQDEESKVIMILRKNIPIADQPLDEVQKLVQFFSEFETPSVTFTKDKERTVTSKREEKNSPREKTDDPVSNPHTMSFHRLFSSTSSRSGLTDPLLQN